MNKLTFSILEIEVNIGIYLFILYFTRLTLTRPWFATDENVESKEKAAELPTQDGGVTEPLNAAMDSLFSKWILGSN